MLTRIYFSIEYKVKVQTVHRVCFDKRSHKKNNTYEIISKVDYSVLCDLNAHYDFGFLRCL